MSREARDWAWQQITVWRDELHPSSKLILLYLAERADEYGDCWPGHEKIAEGTGLSVRSVKRRLPPLVELGLVETWRRHRPDGTRTSNGYRLGANRGPQVGRP